MITPPRSLILNPPKATKTAILNGKFNKITLEGLYDYKVGEEISLCFPHAILAQIKKVKQVEEKTLIEWENIHFSK